LGFDCGKCFAQHANGFIHIGFADVQRRRHPDNVRPQSPLADQQAGIARGIQQLVGFLRGWLFGFAVLRRS